MVITPKNIEVLDCECLKCGNKWTSKTKTRPKRCPDCARKRWWIPKRIKPGQEVKEIKKDPAPIIEPSKLIPEKKEEEKPEIKFSLDNPDF